MFLLRHRRYKKTYIAIGMLIIWLIMWGYLAIVIASPVVESKEVVTQSDVIAAQFKLIAWLVGILQLIGGGFLIYVVRDVKQSLRALTNAQKDVMTHDAHKEIDHSQYCPVCRQ